MKREIPLSVPVIRGNEWKYVKDCLDTGWVSYVGSYVGKFEKSVAGYVGAKYAVAAVNGTCALHVSLAACGVNRGDEVIVPALTFIAPANAVRYCGAEPVFMDCDPRTLCLDVDKTANFIKDKTARKKDGLTYNKDTGRKIKAVIPVHVFGHPADMSALTEICAESNIDIIEDATESLGSKYKGRETGSLGKIGCFSFNGNKIITTGGGGMIVTDDGKLAGKIRHLTTQAKSDPLEYIHDEVGYNYRLSNIQAAMGLAQMEKLDGYITAKRRNARLYKELFSGLDGLEFLWEMPWAKSNFWFYTIKVPKGRRKPLIKRLLSEGAQVRPVWKPINSLPMYRGCPAYKIERAAEAYDTCINIPCSVNLKEDEIRFIAKAVKRYFSREK
jgi:perosamine synthetase